MAKRRQAARAVDIVRNLRHVLHTTGNLSLSMAKLDVLGGKCDGLETGSADLVDGDGLDGFGESSKDGRLASGRLADRGLQDISHVNIGNLLNGNLGLFKSRLDGRSTELGGGDTEERAIELCIVSDCAAF